MILSLTYQLIVIYVNDNTSNKMCGFVSLDSDLKDSKALILAVLHL